MAYRASTKANGLSTSASTLVPTGAASGDIMLLIVSCDDTPLTFTWPSGFTQLDTQANTGDGQQTGIAWKRLSAGDTGSYATTLSASTDWVATAVAFSGRDATNPPVASTALVVNAAGNTIATNAVTAVAGDDLAFLAALDTSSAGTETWTAPTGFTSQQNAVQGNFCNTEAATQDNVSAGSVSPSGSISGTQTIAGHVAWVVRIPVSGGGGTTLTASASDSTSTSESVSAKLSTSQVSVSESTTVSETVAVQLLSTGLNITVSDSVSHTETISAVEPNALQVSSSDSVSHSETVSVTPPATTLSVNVSDSVTTSEFIVVAFDPSTIFTLEVNVSDSVTTTESKTASMANLTISGSDSVSTTETVGALETSFINVSQSVSTTDTPTVAPLLIGASASDSTSVSESVTVVRLAQGTLSINVTDSVSVSENVTSKLPNALQVAVSDATTVSESRLVSFGFVPNIDLPTSFKIKAVPGTLAIKADPATIKLRADNVTGAISAERVTFSIRPDATKLAIRPDAISTAIDGDTT